MPAEQRGRVIAVEHGPTGLNREEPEVQRKAAAFAWWHEPDDARVSRPDVCPGKAGVFSRRQTCRGKSQAPRSSDGRGGGKPRLGISFLLLAAGGTYTLLRAQSGVAEKSACTGAPPARPLPVTAGIVETKDFPIYRVGLGTVQAYNTVTIKVRVDGEIQKIAFHEGQDVRTGDLLAQIDPRPYEALLRQAEADKGRLSARTTSTAGPPGRGFAVGYLARPGCADRPPAGPVTEEHLPRRSRSVAAHFDPKRTSTSAVTSVLRKDDCRGRDCRPKCSCGPNLIR